MQSKQTSVIIALTLLAVFASTAAALAGTLTTPALFLGGPSGQNVCVAINVGPTAFDVTVEVVGLFTGTDSQTCTLEPNDLDSNCQAFRNDMAFCRVTAPSTKLKYVRAVMMNRSTASPFTIHSTVEAR
jgi:hypothetical protein